ncbi:MAG TPA: hypothetical protein VFA18_15595 [Gemmataceae bacterium]|nr:hypothetical protein [Gemmataceae bacterium]
MNKPSFVVGFLLFLSTSTILAQDVASGPEKGAKVPALKVHDVTGEYMDKSVDYAAERKDKPTIYLFIRADKFDRPMNRFMKELDKLVKKDFEDTYIVAVWLTEEADKTKEFLPRVQQSVQYEATALTYYPGDKTGPKDWNINLDAHLTAVVANKQKVAAKFAYNSLNETDVPGVRDALKKAREAK